jgi:GNAT superfamily N-acetyltransferase
VSALGVPARSTPCARQDAYPNIALADRFADASVVDCQDVHPIGHLVSVRAWTVTLEAAIIEEVEVESLSTARPRVSVRDFDDADWPHTWAIIHEVVAKGDTFCYEPTMTERQARANWVLAPPARVAVAVDHLGRVVGTSNMYSNRPGPGSHVASGSLMVDAGCRGHGIGRALVADMVQWCERSGFVAIQFNAVAATNVSAVHLYESVGFRILGTAPGAFRHPTLGFVGLHSIWLDLESAAHASVAR